MTINIFDDQPPQPQRQTPGPVAYGSVPQNLGQSMPPRKRSLGGAALAVAIAAVVVGGVIYTNHQPQSQTASSKAPKSYLLEPAAARSAGECVDSSGSARDGGALARMTLRTTRDVVKSWTKGASIPTNGKVSPQAGLKLVVRVVEPDSFGTGDSDAHTVVASIPGVSGLSDAEPVPSENDYVTKKDQFDADHTRATSELTAARQSGNGAGTGIERLISQTSSGSDVTGCVLALADILGAGSDILVVSDLQDTRFTAANSRQLAGRMNGIRLWIVQACPSGVPTTCDAQRAEFIGRLKPLGLSTDSVTTVRPELGAQVVHQWLGR